MVKDNILEVAQYEIKLSKDDEGDWIATEVSDKKYKYLSGISKYKNCAIRILLDAIRSCRDMEHETVLGRNSDDICHHCKKSNDTWFDRSVIYDEQGHELEYETYATRCVKCGKNVNAPISYYDNISNKGVLDV